MLTQIGNIHKSKIPKIGQTGYLIMSVNRWGEFRYFDGRKRKYQVIAYPLCDNVRKFSIGIHTAFFKNLQDGKVIRVSGFYFISE